MRRLETPKPTISKLNSSEHQRAPTKDDTGRDPAMRNSPTTSGSRTIRTTRSCATVAASPLGKNARLFPVTFVTCHGTWIALNHRLLLLRNATATANLNTHGCALTTSMVCFPTSRPTLKFRLRSKCSQALAVHTRSVVPKMPVSSTLVCVVVSRTMVSLRSRTSPAMMRVKMRKPILLA